MRNKSIIFCNNYDFSLKFDFLKVGFFNSNVQIVILFARPVESCTPPIAPSKCKRSLMKGKAMFVYRNFHSVLSLRVFWFQAYFHQIKEIKSGVSSNVGDTCSFLRAALWVNFQRELIHIRNERGEKKIIFPVFIIVEAYFTTFALRKWLNIRILLA